MSTPVFHQRQGNKIAEDQEKLSELLIKLFALLFFSILKEDNERVQKAGIQMDYEQRYHKICTKWKVLARLGKKQLSDMAVTCKFVNGYKTSNKWVAPTKWSHLTTILSNYVFICTTQSSLGTVGVKMKNGIKKSIKQMCEREGIINIVYSSF